MIGMELVIPQVVYEELLFQQTTSASKSLERATKAFAEVSAVTAKPLAHRLTVPRLKQHVRRKLDKWVIDRGAAVRPVPCAAIDWEKLIEKALWREPPFAYDPRNPGSEKGFRDALVMETVVEYCRTETRDVIPVFICEDNLLRTAAQRELRDDRRVLFYDSMEGFSSYVRLTKEQLTEQFIKLIMSRAKERFFQKDDQTTLYYRGNIKEQLQEQCAPYVADPQLAVPVSANPLAGLLPTSQWGQDQEKWTSDGPGMFWIGSAKFARLEEPRVYHWVSVVTYIRTFKRQQPPSTGLFARLLSTEDQERALVLSFDVPWQARVTADGRFHDVVAGRIELRHRSFAAPTQEQAEAEGLRSQSS